MSSAEDKSPGRSVPPAKDFFEAPQSPRWQDFFTDAQISLASKLPVVATALLTFVGLVVDLISNEF
ncbi:hypothetical protein ACQ1ZK_16970, partial [Enterococcus faecium]